jgi:hypothetical protein
MRLPVLAVLTVCCLALAACGDDEDATTTADPTPADAPAERCPDADSPPNITNVTAYGTSCEAVEDAMARIGAVSEEFVLGDFDCGRIKGDELAGTWECRGEANYFTFEFAD